MARPLRLDFAGGVYHVIVRGNERKAIFRDNRDRVVYLDRLADCRSRFGFFLYAYCLMGNHVHLALERGPVPLSRIMLTLQSFYSQRFNRRHDRVGHLFQGRFKSLLVEKDRYLFALLRYIHANPVKARLVTRPQDYPWSSDRYFRSGAGPDWLDLDRVLPMLAPTKRQAIARYRQLMKGAIGPLYEDSATIARSIKGDQEFAERVIRESGEVPLHKRNWTVEGIAVAVASFERLSVEELRRRGQAPGPSRARAIAAHLGRIEAGIPVAQMARYFGRDGSTMARGVLKLEAALTHDEQLRARVGAVAARLRAESARVHA